MKKFQNITDKIAPGIIIAVLLMIWQILSMVNIIPKFMLPSPFEVVKAFVYDFPLLMEHTKITLLEAFLGLGMGIILGFAVAVVMDRFDYAFGTLAGIWNIAKDYAYCDDFIFSNNYWASGWISLG